MRRLKEKELKAYLKDSNRCPICKSEDLTGGSFQSDVSTAWQPVICSNCDAKWVDIYTLTDLVNI